VTRSPEGVERPPHPAAPDRRPVSTSSTHAIAQHRRWRRNRRYLWMNTGRLLQAHPHRRAGTPGGRGSTQRSHSLQCARTLHHPLAFWWASTPHSVMPGGRAHHCGSRSRLALRKPRTGNVAVTARHQRRIRKLLPCNIIDAPITVIMTLRLRPRHARAGGGRGSGRMAEENRFRSPVDSHRRACR